MRHDCWAIWPDRGFLINPDPLISTKQALDGLIATDALEHIESIATDLPALLLSERARPLFEKLPRYDFSPLTPELNKVDFRAVERLMQIYSYFASAFVYGVAEKPEKRIPEGVAAPLVQLAAMVERPPILSYSNYVLANWRRPVPSAPILVDDLRLIQNFLGSRGESWFILIHVDIEARAVEALKNLHTAVQSVEQDDPAKLEKALAGIGESISQMVATFRRMAEACDSKVYYFKVRPYIFGFDDVIYEGVHAYAGKPQTFRGQTDAQSSIVPALIAALGLAHEQNSLTHSLEMTKAYMPKPHREFVHEMSLTGIRENVRWHADRAPLVEAYNECLLRVVEFRSLHYFFASEHDFTKAENPPGASETGFMDWQKLLRDEAEQQLIQPVPHMAHYSMR